MRHADKPTQELYGFTLFESDAVMIENLKKDIPGRAPESDLDATIRFQGNGSRAERERSLKNDRCLYIGKYATIYKQAGGSYWGGHDRCYMETEIYRIPHVTRISVSVYADGAIKTKSLGKVTRAEPLTKARLATILEEQKPYTDGEAYFEDLARNRAKWREDAIKAEAERESRSSAEAREQAVLRFGYAVLELMADGEERSSHGFTGAVTGAAIAEGLLSNTVGRKLTTDKEWLERIVEENRQEEARSES